MTLSMPSGRADHLPRRIHHPGRRGVQHVTPVRTRCEAADAARDNPDANLGMSRHRSGAEELAVEAKGHMVRQPRLSNLAQVLGVKQNEGGSG